MSLRRAGFAAALGALLALASAGLLELGVRLFDPQVLPHDVPELWTPDPEIGWKRNADVHLVANAGERSVAFCTEAHGDRVDCDAPARGDCAARILAMGDSYVEALSIPYRDTVWARLDADTGACTSVAGVAGWYLSQYVASTRARLAEPGARYDLEILALYAPNDLTGDAEKIPPPMSVQRYPFRLLPAGLSQQALLDWFAPMNQWLEARAQAYVAARFAIRRVLDPGDAGIYGVAPSLRRSKATPAWLDETARGVRLIAEDAHAHGAKLLVVVIPHRSQVLDPDGARLLSAMPELAGDLDMELVSRELVPRIQAIPEVDAVVDLQPLLRARAQRSLWGEADPHLSPSGHAAWFEAIRAPVRALLGLPASGG